MSFPIETTGDFDTELIPESSVEDETILENNPLTTKKTNTKKIPPYNILNLYKAGFPKTPQLTAEQEKALAKKIKAGDQKARTEFITSNLTLVLHIAYRYQNRGLELLDLIQAGNIGLMRAVDKFDPELGWRFSTYADHWIRQRITRAIEDFGKTIRLPVHLQQQKRVYFRAKNVLETKLGRVPSDDETMRYLGIQDDTKTIELLQLAWKTNDFSLEDLSPEDSDEGWARVIRDNSVSTPEEHCASHTQKEFFGKLLSSLEPRERLVIELLFGFNGNDEHTLREVGKYIGVTGEYVRQIKEKALKKLRQCKGEILKNT